MHRLLALAALAVAVLGGCGHPSSVPADGQATDASEQDAARPDAAPPLPDAAPSTDAVPPIDAVPAVDAPPLPDADPRGSEATDFAIDPLHDNAQPNDAVATPLKPLWKATFTGAVSYPLVVGGLVIVAANEAQPNVRALDLATGALVWGPKTVTKPATLAYDSGLVFALATNGDVTAFDAATGARAWAIQLGDLVFYNSPPVAAGGRLYINETADGGSTSAYDEHTGALVWSWVSFAGDNGCVAVDGPTLYESEGCGDLHSFDAATGSLHWFHTSSCIGSGNIAPSVHDGMIWDRDGNVIYDAKGNALGTFAAVAHPALHGDTAFYLASIKPSITPYSVNAVGISSDTLLWSFAGDGQLCTSPVVAGGGRQVFVGSQSGNLYELDEATGKQIAVDNVGAAITCFSEKDSMALAENHLLVPAGNELVVY